MWNAPHCSTASPSATSCAAAVDEPRLSAPYSSARPRDLVVVGLVGLPEIRGVRAGNRALAPASSAARRSCRGRRRTRCRPFAGRKALEDIGHREVSDLTSYPAPALAVLAHVANGEHAIRDCRTDDKYPSVRAVPSHAAPVLLSLGQPTVGVEDSAGIRGEEMRQRCRPGLCVRAAAAAGPRWRQPSAWWCRRCGP